MSDPETTALSALSERIAAVAAIDPAAPAIEFGRRWRTWGELGTTIDAVAGVVPRPGTAVGVVLRNRPAQVGAMLGVLRAGGCLVAINPGRGAARTLDDIAGLDMSYLAGSSEDLSSLVGVHPGPSLIEIDDLGTPVATRAGGRGGHGERPGVAVRMLTSGTTGPPKRVDLTYRTLEHVLAGAKHYETNRQNGPRLRSGVAIVNSPLVHLGGLFRVLQCVNDGRSFALLERFTVDGWVDAVRRHRPQTASLVPAAVRMVLEADVEPADLVSIRSIVSGTAPLSPDDADAFSAKYGIPVLVSYAATEFGGGVAGWNLADHRRWWATKKGSVGRAHPGCELRVSDGLLEVKAAQLGGDSWVRTTDLARIDADGFVWILGRADQAIVRGGFKIHPDDVRAALERHQRVRAAAVIGRDDRRLGAVPVAVVELRPGEAVVTPETLTAHLSGLLAHYEIPTEIRILDVLPRTESGKVNLASIRELFENSDSLEGSSPATEA